MIILYNLSILVLRMLFSIASYFGSKAEAFAAGRRDLFKKLQKAFENNSSPVIWVHCASLGEFEQGRPVIEALKKEWPAHKILLTFFSPSGYEVRKNYDKADFVFYFPWDTHANAQRFISITKPVLAIFVKYEFWYHYSAELKKHNIPLLSISSIFRKDQLFFKSYGGFYRRILQNFSYFFVQNDISLKLLQSIGIQQCKKAGDTRFDRVVALTQMTTPLPMVEKFKDGQHTWVIGSCWAEDIDVLAPFINENQGKLKFIVAPHEIKEAFLQVIENQVQAKSIRLSEANAEKVANYNVLIIDNIGMLSKLYRYGEFAYVGGAFGKGLHNILEPACYGIPVFFGNRNYEKFQEANDLIMRGGAFEISDYQDLRSKYELLISRPENYVLACEVTSLYVKENLGATDLIMQYCRKLLAS
ncbi:MAG TPA: glycosyltransferase N-terminal domain-containing protein [Cyclobacteriaceae bacterium]